MNAFFWSFYGLHTILHTLSLGCSFRTLRDPCKNQRPRCDIAWLHVINHSYHGKTVKQPNPMQRSTV